MTDGTQNTTSTPDPNPHAPTGAPALSALWQRHVGGLSQLSYGPPPDRSLASHPQDPPLYHPGLPAVPEALPAGRRRTAGAAQARVWPRCHHLGGGPALRPAPQSPRDPSGVGAPPRCHCPPDSPSPPGTL